MVVHETPLNYLVEIVLRFLSAVVKPLIFSGTNTCTPEADINILGRCPAIFLPSNGTWWLFSNGRSIFFLFIFLSTIFQKKIVRSLHFYGARQSKKCPDRYKRCVSSRKNFRQKGSFPYKICSCLRLFPRSSCKIGNFLPLLLKKQYRKNHSSTDFIPSYIHKFCRYESMNLSVRNIFNLFQKFSRQLLPQIKPKGTFLETGFII